MSYRPPPESLGLVASTNEFTAFVKKNSCRFGPNNKGFTFIDREINPRRTTRAIFPDKSSARKSGSGGIDLFLRSEETGFPVVGEVKVKNDKNAFYALIQAMCYAVEFSTESQLCRIKTHYPEPFKNLNVKDAKTEIAIILVNHENNSTRSDVIELIKDVNKSKKFERLGKITLLTNEKDNWIAFP